jgi:hypothetical protein
MLLSGENGHHFNEDRQSLVLFNSIARWRGISLFFGAAIGLAFTDLPGLVLHLQPNDRIALTVAGMSACLGEILEEPVARWIFHI